MSNKMHVSIFAHPALGFFTSGTCLGLQFCLLWNFSGVGVSSSVFFLGIFGLISACIPIAFKAFSVRITDLLIILFAGMLMSYSFPLYLKPDSHFLLFLALSILISALGVFRTWSWHKQQKTISTEDK